MEYWEQQSSFSFPVSTLNAPIMNSFPKEDKKIAIYFIVGMFITFLLLTLYVTLFPPTFIDIEFSEEVQENMSPFLDVMMKTVSWFGNKPQSIIVPLGIAIIFLDTRYKMEAFFTLLSLLASAINYGIKILVNRPRPTDDLVNVIIDAKYQSFPSGHTVHYVVFFSFLAFLMYRLKKIPNFIRITVASLSLLLIFTVPFSRVYLGAHWFTDVTAGFLFGALYLSGLIYIYLRKSHVL